MISIVIPLYNKEKQIRATLDSVLSQTFQDFEIVIVNDGSTDRSVEEALAVNDPRIRLIHQENAGVSAARNRGIEEAKGEFIAFLDADDRWKPEYLQTQYELTQRYPECSVFACNYEFVDDLGQVRPSIIRKLSFAGEHGMLSNYFEVASCSHPPLWTSAVMVRKEAIQSIGGFPLGVRSGEDLLTWARLACRYKIVYSKRPLAQFVVDISHHITQEVSRPHDEGDEVGEGLVQLRKNEHRAAQKKGLGKYIALWYKMRLSVCVRMGKRVDACRYAWLSLRYHVWSLKVWLMWGLVLMPAFVRKWVIKKYAQI